METTSTDRVAALRAVRKLEESKRSRYMNLSSSENKPAEKPLQKIEKQVDPRWLHQRRHGGPGPDDVAILYSPDPEVRLHVQVESWKERVGVTHSIDPATLHPLFDMTVSIDDIFGPLKATPFTKEEQGLINSIKQRNLHKIIKRMID